MGEHIRLSKAGVGTEIERGGDMENGSIDFSRPVAEMPPARITPSSPEPSGRVPARSFMSSPGTDQVVLSEQGRSLGIIHSTEPGATAQTNPPRHPGGEWEQDRLSKLDQLELLVQKGQYNIVPFMVDEIALRLARFMILA